MGANFRKRLSQANQELLAGGVLSSCRGYYSKGYIPFLGYLGVGGTHVFCGGENI